MDGARQGKRARRLRARPREDRFVQALLAPAGLNSAGLGLARQGRAGPERKREEAKMSQAVEQELFLSTSQWTLPTLRRDGLRVVKTADKRWAVLPGPGQVTIDCPCCTRPLLSLRQARACADFAHPLPSEAA